MCAGRGLGEGDRILGSIEERPEKWSTRFNQEEARDGLRREPEAKLEWLKAFLLVSKHFVRASKTVCKQAAKPVLGKYGYFSGPPEFPGK